MPVLPNISVMPSTQTHQATLPLLFLFFFPSLSVLPWLEGKCTHEGILVLLHYGNQDFQWEMYLGNRRLDWELVELGGYIMKTEEDYFSIELPLYSLGMTYEVCAIPSC